MTEGSTPMDLAVCVLFFERLQQTLECIRSVVGAGVPIHILNNGSCPAQRLALGEFCEAFDPITIYDADRNLGVAGGRNYMITHSREQWLLFLDSDIVVTTADWMERLAQHIGRHPDGEVFIPRVFRVHDNRYNRWHSFSVANSEPGRLGPVISLIGRLVGSRPRPQVRHDAPITDDTTNSFPGGASLIHRRLFERLGLYDDRMFVGFEDFEICIRALLAGSPVRARLVHDVELVHDHRRSSTPEDRRAAMVRYDPNILAVSFERLINKHRVVFQGNWRRWAARQRIRLLGGADRVPRWRDRVT